MTSGRPSERPASHRNTTRCGGPPGIRTPNLRIKSLVEECWSEPWTSSELAVFVSTHPIVSRCFPFLHGDETGSRPRQALTFPPHRVPSARSGSSCVGLPEPQPIISAFYVSESGVRPLRSSRGSATSRVRRRELNQSSVRWLEAASAEVEVAEVVFEPEVGRSCRSSPRRIT